MLEELLRTDFSNGCYEAVKDERLAWLKGERRQERQFKDFFSFGSSIQWNTVPLAMVMKSRVGSVSRMCWMYFNENGERIFKAYIKKRFGGDTREAMRQAGSFNVLFDDFKSYFCDRRTQFMEKTDKLISERREALKKQGKAPQSHGGVANLLKILTKTMHDQGSSVYTIAKVQYAVCIQAGIYIPEEFLTDILVADELTEAVR